MGDVKQQMEITAEMLKIAKELVEKGIVTNYFTIGKSYFVVKMDLILPISEEGLEDFKKCHEIIENIVYHKARFMSSKRERK
ncbi:MAG: hypothetical protein ACP5O8_04180 [Candidatus Aenigmatarchaeota archaeon]